jgi:hypothetical protein
MGTVIGTLTLQLLYYVLAPTLISRWAGRVLARLLLECVIPGLILVRECAVELALEGIHCGRSYLLPC